MGLTESQIISEMYVLVPNMFLLAEESNCSDEPFQLYPSWDGVERADFYPLSYSLHWPMGMHAPAVLISVKL